MWILSTTFQGNDFKTRNFVSKGMRAFNRQPDSFLNFMENLTQLNIKQPDGSLYESASFQVDLKRFDNCIKQIAVGLYFHHTKSKWVGNYGVITNVFVELTGANVEKVNQTIFDASKSVRESFAGYPAYGDNPEIFTYKYAFDQQNSHVIHMIFYEGVDISVLLGD